MPTMSSASKNLASSFAYGIGLARRDDIGTLDVWFALLACGDGRAGTQALDATLVGDTDAGVTEIRGNLSDEILRALGPIGETLAPMLSRDRDQSDGLVPILVCLDEDAAIARIEEAYLKLHLISARFKKPNSLNLEGLFEVLPTLAWTNLGPMRPDRVAETIVRERLAGRSLQVRLVDKIPPLTDYLIPSGVRIGDASRIRLGAYLGEGTTVMHEGFVNFNAGALGPNMIEGRISQGVVVGKHSDLGGSASIMGTLAGGGKLRVSIGEQCLIGANAGTGISLGDRCTIEAGLYVTAGTPVCLFDSDGKEVARVKARELSGRSDMLFLRNGATGRIECRSNRTSIELNEALHAHN